MAQGKAEDAGGPSPAKDGSAALYRFARRTLLIFKCAGHKAVVYHKAPSLYSIFGGNPASWKLHPAGLKFLLPVPGRNDIIELIFIIRPAACWKALRNIQLSIGACRNGPARSGC